MIPVAQRQEAVLETPAARSTRSIDLAIMLCLAIVMAVISVRHAAMIPPALLLDPAANDMLFESDTARVVETIATFPGKFGVRYFLHPLISEWLYPITAVLRLIPGIDAIAAVGILTALAAGGWIAGIYLLLRLIGCERIDGTLFSLLAGSSAAAIVWFSVPEAHAWASLSLIGALVLAAVSERRDLPVRWHVLGQVVAMSFTITNWLAAMAVSLVNLRWGRFILATGIAGLFGGGLAMVEPVIRKVSQRVVPLSSHTTVLVTALIGVMMAVCLWRMGRRPGVQRVLGSVETLLSRRWMIGLVLIGGVVALAGALRVEAPFIGNPHRGSMLHAARSFTFHSVVLPDFSEADRYGRGWPTLSVQAAAIGDRSSWGIAAAGLWALLLIAGVFAAFRIERLRRFRRVLAIALLGQFVLHLIYGDETFLYALNWLPLLIVLAAMATQTHLQAAIRIVVAIAIVLAATHNLRQFDRAAARLTTYAAAHGNHAP